MPKFLQVAEQNLIFDTGEATGRFDQYTVDNNRDCLFTSVAFLLRAYGLRPSLDGTTARVLRNETVQALQDLRNKESTRGTFDTIQVQKAIKDAYEDGWGDRLALRALAERYGCAIQVWWLHTSGSRSVKMVAKLKFEAHATSDYSKKNYNLPISDNVLYLRIMNEDPLRPHFVPLLPATETDPDIVPEPAGAEISSLYVMSEAAGAKKARKLHQVRRTVWGAEPYNTLDSLVPLPLVDNHAHLGGKSMGGSGAAGKLFAGRVIWSGGMGSFLYYNTSAEETLVTKLINSMKHFCSDKQLVENVAACAMVLDFGYIPMRLGRAATANKHKLAKEASKATQGGLLTRASHTRNERLYYTAPSTPQKNVEQFAWFPRSRVAFEEALDKIVASARVFPGMIWPFVGFDPRRPDGLEIVKKYVPAKGFIGVKLYSRTGWMPIHNRKLYGDVAGDELDGRLDALYAYLVEKDLPVLVHASPTGFPPDSMGPLAGDDEIAPGHNVLVLPWSYTNQRMIEANAWRCTVGDHPRAYAQVAAPLFPPTFSDDEVALTPGWASPPRLDDSAQRIINKYASYFAHYCLYNQLTTSPYTWETVLTKYPNLRLCLAHFGADIGAYATLSNRMPMIEKWQVGLERHPYVAGTAPRNAQGQFATPAHEEKSFKYLFLRGLMRGVRKFITDNGMHDRIQRIIDDGFFTQGEWHRWFQAWEQNYPLTWPEKILSLLASNNYPNLYTDIAYVTTDPTLFPHAIVPLINKAWNETTPEGRALKKKLLIGTDWFMIEMQSCSPRDFWNMAWNAFQEVRRSKMEEEHFETNLQILWRMWSSENTLRWVNLATRMRQLETFYGGKVPVWWETLKEHYSSGRSDRVPLYIAPQADAAPGGLGAQPPPPARDEAPRLDAAPGPDADQPVADAAPNEPERIGLPVREIVEGALQPDEAARP